MIKTKCGSCGKVYQLPPEAAGKKAKCKACGKVMAIPPAKDDPLGLGGAASDSDAAAKGDMSSLYGGGGDDPVASASAAEPAVFNPGVSFQNTKPKQPLPLKPILIGVGGLVALVVIVILATSLLGGGDKADEKNTGPGGLSLGVGSVPTTSGLDDLVRPTSKTPGKTTGSKGEQLLPESPEDVVGWTLAIAPQTSEEAQLLESHSFRNQSFQLPAGWETVNMNQELAGFGEQDLDEPGLFMAMQPEHAMVLGAVHYPVTDRPKGDWPEISVVKQLSYKMFEQDGTYTEDTRPEDLPVVAFDTDKPRKIYIRSDALLESSFGTLFGGFPFVRLVVDPINMDPMPGSETPSKSVIYAGYLGDVLTLFRIDLTDKSAPHQAGLEAIVHSAKLLDKGASLLWADNDETYSKLIKSDTYKLVFAGDDKPMPGKTPSGGASTGDLVALAAATQPAPDLAAPHNKDHGFLPPEDFEVLSTTRTAIRTKPLADGSWMSFEVHKLMGLERRLESPIDAENKTVLLRGRVEPMPPGVELTQMTAGPYTVHRLLYPEPSDDSPRQVDYLIKDGMFLITLRGLFPADAPDRLKQLDEAAVSVRKMPEPIEDDEPDFRIKAADESDEDDG